MKKLFTIALFFLSAVSAKATNMTIGTGSGSLIQNSMGTMVSGDTLFLNAGTYTGGGQFSNIHDITIINKGGVVTIKGTVDWGNQTNSLNNITVTGTGGGLTNAIIFDATGSYSNGPLGYTTNSGFAFTAQHYVHNRFYYIWFKGIGANCFDLSGYLPTYDGTTGSYKIYQSSFDHCRMDNSLEFYQGPYIGPNLGFADSIDIGYNLFNQTSGNGMQMNTQMTNGHIHDNQILYSGLNTQTDDVGVFVISGFVQLDHNYMKGGRGYLMRNFGYSYIGTPATVLCFDNIKIATTTYGMFDLRTDSSFYNTSGFLAHCDFTIINNTEGNLSANDPSGGGNNYNTPVALFYVLSGGAHGICKNNLAFNVIPGNSGGYVCISFVGVNFQQIDTSNNRYFTAPTILNALSDTTAQCAVKTGSSLIGQGLHFASVTTDYVYFPFSNPPTIGAREYQSAAVICNAGSNQSFTKPPTSSATLTSSSTGSISSYNWVQTSGPNTATLTNGTTSTATASNLIVGTYVFQLQLNSNTVNCTTQVQVNAHTAPVANAGSNSQITLPTTSTTLSGSGTTSDGATIASYSWAKVSGTGGTIVSPTSQNTSVTGLSQGTYVFSLTVVDNFGTSSTPANVTVIVNPAITGCANCVLANASGRFYKRHVGKFFY